MWWQKEKVNRSDIKPEVIRLFLGSYVEIMKHASDTTDAAMKRYLLSLIRELGIPEEGECETQDVTPQEEYEPPIIKRRVYAVK